MASPRGKTKVRRLPLPLWVALALSAAAVILVARAEIKLNGLVLGGLGESFPTRIFAAPAALGEDAPQDPGRLLERLQRLGYRAASPPAEAGQYEWRAPVLEIFLRGFSAPLPAQPAGLFRLTVGADGGITASDASGSPVPRVWLEPETMTELSGAKRIRREPAASDEIPELLAQAVVAAEDKRFYQHWGIDPRAVLRSAWHDLAHRSELQGGSTITQQLAKNLFLSPRRTLRRKLAEAAFSLYLELRLSKARILAIYLNHIYMGQDGPVSVAGVKAAAEFYFDKGLSRLTPAECAMLAGIIRSPYRYNPRRDPLAAQERRDFILRRMREEGYLSEPELRQALAEPLRPPPRPSRARRGNDYFVAETVRQLLPRYGEDVLFRNGLSIYTTLDPLLQTAAQHAVRGIRSQAALVALDPDDGRVLALVGGKDFSESQFNRATQARRQPGSAFKPFFYAAALEKGYTPVSVLEDSPKTYPGAGRVWKPKNYDGVFYGTTTLRTALAHSLNAATLDLANQIGPAAAADLARRLGIASPLEESLALALGASEVSLLEITAAYAAFANGGWRVEPRMVDAIYDAEGNILEFPSGERQKALEPAQAFLMTSLLRSVVEEGTARSLPALGFDRPSAGKTGTTDEGRDAWFIGYTPRLLAGVWVGDDKNQALGLTGAKDALPAWAAFMRAACAGPVQDFAQPQGLVSVDIDPASGLRARSGCPQRRKEMFVDGTQPTADCPLHRGGVVGWLKKWFGR